MMPLDHAEAHERLADLALEPGALDDLGSPASDPLAAHVAACAICRGNVDGWRRTHARLAAARGPVEDRVALADLAADEPIVAPPELRDAVLARIRAAAPAAEVPTAATDLPIRPVVPAPGPGLRRASVAAQWFLPLAAVVAVVVIGGGLLFAQTLRLDEARQQTAALEAVAATVDRILRDPGHQVVDLRSPDGQVEGSLSWSSRDIAVLTTALTPPPAGQEYRCWIERDGARSRVGTMWFAAGTAFWNGSLDEWATTAIEAGGTFGVSLEPTDAPGGNPAVLAADLGS